MSMMICVHCRPDPAQGVSPRSERRYFFNPHYISGVIPDAEGNPLVVAMMAAPSGQMFIPVEETMSEVVQLFAAANQSEGGDGHYMMISKGKPETCRF